MDEAPKESADIDKLARKDVLALSVSTLSFITSLVSLVVAVSTAFFTYVRQLDDMRMVVSAVAPPAGKRDGPLTAPGGYIPFAIINLGNRPAVLLNMRVVYFIRGQYVSLEQECSGIPRGAFQSIWLDTDFRSTVIKDKEAMTKSLRVTNGDPADTRVRTADDGSVQFSLFDKKQDLVYDLLGSNFEIGACLVVGIATPSVAYHQASVPLGEYIPTKDSTYVVKSSTVDAAASRPKLLIQKSYTVFDDLIEEFRRSEQRDRSQ